MARKLTTEEYLERCVEKWGDYFDLSRVNYDGEETIITIGCPVHSWVEVKAYGFVKSKFGCPDCGNDKSGRKAKTTEQFKKEFVERWGNLYDLSLVDYVNDATDVTIICPYHGRQTSRPSSLLSKRRLTPCSKCSQEATVNTRKKKTNNKKYHRLTDEIVRKELKEKRLDMRFSYDNTKLIKEGKNTYITIECIHHGEIKVPYHGFLNGSNCPECAKEEASKKNRKTNEQFEKESIVKHGDKFIYDRLNYKKNNIPVELGCKIHGNYFPITPVEHLNSPPGLGGCPECKKEHLSKINRSNNEDFIQKSENLYGKGRFGYDDLDYTTEHGEINLTCIEHGTVFYTTPNRHLRGDVSCCLCKGSEGEKAVSLHLSRLNLAFRTEKPLYGCPDAKNPLRWDFYLPEYNLYIEYNGRQHYEPVEIFGGILGFIDRKKKDNYKRIWARKNEAYLLEIPYNQYKNTGIIINKYLEKIKNAG